MLLCQKKKKKKKITTNYIKEVSIKRHAKKIRYYQISKNYCKLLANSLAMITQFLQMNINEISKQQQVTINYIEEIRIKSDAKKIRCYQLSKNYCKFRPILWPWSHNSYK